VTPQQIEYSEVEHIWGDNLIQYKGKVYQTKENLQTFPDTLTLVDEGITREEFYNIYDRLLLSLNHGVW